MSAAELTVKAFEEWRVHASVCKRDKPCSECLALWDVVGHFHNMAMAYLRTGSKLRPPVPATARLNDVLDDDARKRGLLPDKTLADQANDNMIASVKTDKPSQFTVGGHYDSSTGKVIGGITYDRKLTTAFGLTAYAKAFFTHKPIFPQDKFGVVVGGEGVWKF